MKLSNIQFLIIEAKYDELKYYLHAVRKATPKLTFLTGIFNDKQVTFNGSTLYHFFQKKSFS